MIREDTLSASSGQAQELDPLQFEQFAPEFSAEKIQSGILQSKRGKAVFNLENDFFKITDGVSDLIRYGVLTDGTLGISILDDFGNEIGRINTSGFFIQNGKISIFNDKNKEIINSNGLLSVNNFETKTIFDDKTYEISINNPAYKDMGPTFNITVDRPRILLVLAAATGSTDVLTEPTRMILAINNVNRTPEGIVNSTTIGTATLFYIELLQVGTYNLKLRYGKGVVATQAGILEGLRFSYILI